MNKTKSGDSKNKDKEQHENLESVGYRRIGSYGSHGINFYRPHRVETLEERKRRDEENLLMGMVLTMMVEETVDKKISKTFKMIKDYVYNNYGYHVKKEQPNKYLIEVKSIMGLGVILSIDYRPNGDYKIRLLQGHQKLRRAFWWYTSLAKNVELWHHFTHLVGGRTLTMPYVPNYETVVRTITSDLILKRFIHEFFTMLLKEFKKSGGLYLEYNKKLCQNCLKQFDKLKKCVGCRLVKYCSRKCQKEDWFRHKRKCMWCQICMNQNKPDHLYKCPGCKMVHYCTIECQKKDWDQIKELGHKGQCKSSKFIPITIYKETEKTRRNKQMI